MARIFLRGNTWWIDYGVDNQRVRRSLETSNERIAREHLKQVRGLAALGQLTGPSHTPLITALESFCRHLDASGKQKSAATDKSRLRGFFGPCCPALHLPSRTAQKYRQPPRTQSVPLVQASGLRLPIDCLENLSPISVKSFLDGRIADGELSAATANKYVEILKRFLGYARDVLGYRCPLPGLKHPLENLRLYPTADPVITFLTQEQIHAQLESLSGNLTLHAMVATLIFAGPRREEVTWLTDDDVDLKKRVLHIRGKTVGDETWSPKTRKNRIVPISSSLHAILTAYRRRRPHGKAPWFFRSPQGERWDPDNFSHRLAKLNEAAGLSWSCLDYRHTFGSQLAQAGRSLYVISTLMGNSEPICRKHYAALMPEQMHDEVEFYRLEGDNGVFRDTVSRGTCGAPYLRLVR